MPSPAAIALLVGTSLQLSSEEPSGQARLRDFLAVALHGWSMVNKPARSPTRASRPDGRPTLAESCVHYTGAMEFTRRCGVQLLGLFCLALNARVLGGSDLILAHGAPLAHSGPN